MGVQTYTEEDLRGKKYGELFKIGKSLGVKSSRKLKTDKLIEAILECQDDNTIAKDVVAIIAALADDQGKNLEKSGCVKPQQQKEIEPTEELLSDVQLPELFPLEEDEPQKAVGESSKTGCLTKNEGNDDDVNEKQVKKRCRTGTFEIEKKTESLTEENAFSVPERQRTSTYDIPNETNNQNPANEVSSVATSQQIEDNSEQLNLLVQKVSKSRTRTVAVHFPATASPSALPSVNQHALPSTKEHVAHRNSRSASKLNLLHDKEVPRVTPATELLSDMSNKSESKLSKAQSITRLKSPYKTTTPPSTWKSQTGVKLPVNTPKSNAKVTQASKIVKPVFTIGRNDSSPAKKERVKCDGSGIPRFLSYARRLKVPNFAKIHERAFNRMEALDDYVDKKRKRTDTIGSATKKPEVAAEAVFQPTVTSTRNLNLNFISTRSPANKTPGFSKSKAVQFEGPKSSKSLSLASAQKVTKKSPKVAETPQNTIKEAPKSSSKSCNTAKKTSDSVKNSTSQPTEESPKRKSFKGSVKKVATFRRKSAKTPPGMASVKRVPSPGHPRALPRLLKENVKPVNVSISHAPSKLVASQNPSTSGSMSKRLKYDPKTTSNIPSSYVPYEGAVKSLTKRDTLKNMAQRKPKTKSRQEICEGQKKILKGVRFNRRFELQMANRGISL